MTRGIGTKISMSNKRKAKEPKRALKKKRIVKESKNINYNDKGVDAYSGDGRDIECMIKEKEDDETLIFVHCVRYIFDER